MADRTIANEIMLSRAVLHRVVQRCRVPKPTDSDADLRMALTCAAILARETDAVETYAHAMALTRTFSLSRALKAARRDRRELRTLEGLIQASYDRMQGYRRRLSLTRFGAAGTRDYMVPEPITGLDADELIDLCFDAALACEMNYETAAERSSDAEDQRSVASAA